jgi:hypothetical protein
MCAMCYPYTRYSVLPVYVDHTQGAPNKPMKADGRLRRPQLIGGVESVEKVLEWV